MTSSSTVATTTPRATCSTSRVGRRTKPPMRHSPGRATASGTDENGEVIGVTVINARRIIEHDGYLTITLPHSVRVEAGELAAALG